MQFSLALLALAAAAANASPFAFPQAVTAIITPSGSAPPGCMPTFVGSFGIAVQNISTAAPARRQVTEITDGQPQAPAATGMTSALTMPLVMTTIKTSVMTTPSVMTTIKSSVTTTPAVVTTIKTSVLTTPSVVATVKPSNMTTAVAITTVKTSVVNTTVAVTTVKTSVMTTVAAVTTVKTSVMTTVAAVTTVKTSVITTPAVVATIMTMASVSQFTDGQIQGGMHNMTVMPIVTSMTSMTMPVITVAPVTEFTDGQPQAPVINMMPTTTSHTTVLAVSEFTDGQPQALMPTTTAPAMSMMTSMMTSVKPATTAVAAPVSPPAAMGMQMVACETNGTLALTLANGILKDSFGRTGYIASNFQFQFDNPPQSGALITAGFSVCANGSLALGGSNVFFQCRSGDFYNLYTENWAPQCSPVTINTVMLLSCMT